MPKKNEPDSPIKVDKIKLVPNNQDYICFLFFGKIIK